MADIEILVAEKEVGIEIDTEFGDLILHFGGGERFVLTTTPELRRRLAQALGRSGHYAQAARDAGRTREGDPA